MSTLTTEALEQQAKETAMAIRGIRNVGGDDYFARRLIGNYMVVLNQINAELARRKQAAESASSVNS